MSRHHGSIASEINHTIHSLQNMSNDEIKKFYGVTISEDGSIYDPTYNMNFDDLSMWATFCVEQDHTEQYEHITHADEYEYY